MFCECDKIKPIWNIFKSWLFEKTGIDCNCSYYINILFGITKKNNNILNFVMIMIKFHSYKMKMIKQLPTFDSIQKELYFMYKVEKVTARQMLTDKFI